MDTRQAVLAKIEAFLQRSGMSARRFGIEATGDHKLVKRLRSGAGVTLTVIEKAERYIAEQGGMPRSATAPEDATEHTRASAAA